MFSFVVILTFSWSLENVMTFERPMVGAAVVRNASLTLTVALLQNVAPRNPKCAVAQRRRIMEPKPRTSWA